MLPPQILTENEYKVYATLIQDRYSLSTYMDYQFHIDELLDGLGCGIQWYRRRFLSAFLSVEVIWFKLGGIDKYALEITTESRPGGFTIGLRYLEGESKMYVTIMEGGIRELKVDSKMAFVDLIEEKAREFVKGPMYIPIV